MDVTISHRRSAKAGMTLVYQFFDPTVLGHLWFVAMTDGVSVQLMPPTFQSERAARVFERCIAEHPSEALLTIDGQLELARRIENGLASGQSPEDLVASGPWEDLPLDRAGHTLGHPAPSRTGSGGPVYT